ncbi:MAG TPA: MFS transporter, partial [Vicinamibacterales bacterium]|nr:MFS transporter [Vicinamibacterales bacterium]
MTLRTDGNTPSAGDAPQDGEVIALVGLAHGTSHFFHLMLPPLFPWLMRDFSLSYTDVGLLTTTFFVISGVGQALAGFVVDRVGGWRVLCFGVAMLALSGVVLSMATSYAWLMLSAMFAGLGNSIFHPSDFTLLNRRVSQSRLGHAFSIHGVSGNAGWAIAPLFMAGVTNAFGWHVAGFGAAVIGAAVFTTLCLRRRALVDTEGLITSRVATGDAGHGSGQFAFLASGAVWLSFAFFLFTTMAFGILQNFAPAILSHVYGVSLIAASSGLTAYLVGSGTGMLSAGFLRDRADRMVPPALGFAA